MCVIFRNPPLAAMLLVGILAADAAGAARPQIGQANGNLHIRLEENQTVFINDIDVLKELRDLKSRVNKLESAPSHDSNRTAPTQFMCEPTTTPMAPSTSSMCSASVPLILDCRSASSRSAVAELGACEVDAVINCCCDEFYSLTSVKGSVVIGRSTNDLQFGNVSRIGGNVDGLSLSIQWVDFGALTRVEGELNLAGNAITTISLSHLAHVGAGLQLSGNALATVDFGALTHVGGNLRVYGNKLTVIRFNHVTEVGGGVDLRNNELIFVDFCGLTAIGDYLYVNGNDALLSIDCKGADIQGSVSAGSTELVNCN